MTSDSPTRAVIAAFDAAAGTYDSVTQAQRDIARALVARASVAVQPKTILDLGCGAGHVTEALLARWPGADVTALDAAPAMLERLKAKFPGMATVRADAQTLVGLGAYDLIVTSMMAHWLPDPRAALTDWLGHLTPGGRLFVAVPVEGSLSEWRDLLAGAGLRDGLWAFPPENFADGLCEQTEIVAFPARHGDARSFLLSLKGAGAHRSRPGHHPASAAALRRLLRQERLPFTATFRIAFLTLGANALREQQDGNQG
jgi:malonyl-CoA O-methyltransferase